MDHLDSLASSQVGFKCVSAPNFVSALAIRELTDLPFFFLVFHTIFSCIRHSSILLVDFSLELLWIDPIRLFSF